MACHNPHGLARSFGVTKLLFNPSILRLFVQIVIYYQFCTISLYNNMHYKYKYFFVSSVFTPLTVEEIISPVQIVN